MLMMTLLTTAKCSGRRRQPQAKMDSLCIAGRLFQREKNPLLNGMFTCWLQCCSNTHRLCYRADGTIKRGRGRGRGGGPGSRGGRGGAATTEGGTRRGGGPGSRGGGTTRKPRITKDERAQMEKEKLQREKMASLVPKPSAYPA